MKGNIEGVGDGKGGDVRVAVEGVEGSELVSV